MAETHTPGLPHVPDVVAEPVRLVAITDFLASLLRRSAAILLVIAFWEVAPRVGLVEPAFLPPFSEVVQAGWKMFQSGFLTTHIVASLARSLTGFGLAIVIAVPLGLLIGWSKLVAELLNPLFEAMRNTAPLALLPVFLLLFGIGETSKIVLVTYACAWPILINTVSGVSTVDPLLIRSARTMGVSKLGMLRKVILPAALPSVFSGIRLSGGYSLLVLVAAEMVGAKAGLGYLVIYAQYNFQIPEMYVGIVTITIVGLAFARILAAIERRLSPWKSAS